MGDILGSTRSMWRWNVLGTTASVLALLVACGGDDDDGSNGAGGTAGSAGTAGSGGSAVSGGSAGDGGSAGGGTTSSGGTAGSGGGSGGSAGEGGGSTVTTEIGPEGGTVTGPDGVELVVPEGALGEPLLFSITKDPDDAPAAPAGVSWVGSVYAIEPHGTSFSEPVTIRLPFDAGAVPEELTPAAFKAEPGGAFARVADATFGATSVELEVTELSFFASGIPASFSGVMRPTDVAAYPGGGAVVVGIAEGATRVIKVDESGAASWERVTQGTLTFAQALPRVAVGPTGNVYVATATSTDEEGTDLGGGSQVRVTSYDPSGSTRAGFPVRFGVAAHSFPTDVTVDVDDDVYVVGTQLPADALSHDQYRPFLLSYGEDGSLLGAGAVDMGGSEPSRRIFSQSVALAPNGSIYMNAQVMPFGAGVDPGAGTRLIAFDGNGATVEGYPKRLSETTTSSQMAVSGTGICYVLESNDERLLALDPSGTNVTGFPQAATLPESGDHAIAGFSAAENSFAVGVTGNLYFVGTAKEQPGNPGPEGTSDVFLQSLDVTGAQRAGFPVYLATPDADSAVAVSIDAAGANAWVAWYVDSAPVLGFVTRVPVN